MKRNICMD